MIRDRQLVRAAILALVAVGLAAPAAVQAQGFEPINTRAAGMAGAFVAAADDASAVYWNPGALASGALFSVLADHTTSRALGEAPTEDTLGGTRTATLVALTTPPFGISYYRLRSSWVSPSLADPTVSVTETLITHNTGFTLVHSLGDGIAIGTTARLVRGIAGSTLTSAGSVEDHLDEAGDLIGEGSNKFDADAGISAVFGTLRAGLAVRNLVAPSFETAGSATELKLERQGRAGIALSSPLGFMIALDMDLNAVRGPIGRVRDFALGTEAHFLPRAYGRAGLRFNTLGDEPGGRAPTYSVGGSFAPLTWLWIDGEATMGAETGRRGWGVAGRVGF